MKAYYEARAEEYDDWWEGSGLFEQRDRPGWETERESLFVALAALQPVPTLDVACGTGYLTRYLPGRVTGLDQSAAMLEIAARRIPSARFVRADALPLPFADRSFGRVFTSHFYGHLEEDDRSSFLTEARRVAPELVIVDSALREDVERGRVATANVERRLAVAGLQAVLRAGRARRGARRRRDPLRRPLVRRRPRVTVRKTSYRSIVSLQRQNARCRACVEAGYPLESWPVRAPYHEQKAYLFGQAPGIVEGEERLPWRGRAGQRLRGWLGLDGDALYETFYCASVTRCYPGRALSGRGDRTPTPREQDLCEFWRDWELELLRPDLIVTVGALALRRLLGIPSLTEAIGKSYMLPHDLGDAIVIPLPHPSGASGWLNDPANRARLGKALTHVKRELVRIHSEP